MTNWILLVWDKLDVYLSGLLVTLHVSALGFLVGAAAGLLVCLVRIYVSPLRWLAIFYIEFTRATPILVQLLWVNYVWPEIFGWPNTTFTAAWTALALQTSGYLAETFRSGIEGVDRGQQDAARAIGMSPLITMFRIILPQILLIMAPSIMNQLIIVLKSSTLVSVIGVADLLYQAQKLVNIWYEPIEILTFTACLYLVIIFLLSSLLNKLCDVLRSRYGLSISSASPA
jgi:polar amino acid transport system permease protein